MWVSGEGEAYADDGDLGYVVGRHVGKSCKREQKVVIGKEAGIM